MCSHSVDSSLFLFLCHVFLIYIAINSLPQPAAIISCSIKELYLHVLGSCRLLGNSLLFYNDSLSMFPSLISFSVSLVESLCHSSKDFCKNVHFVHLFILFLGYLYKEILNRKIKEQYI